MELDEFLHHLHFQIDEVRPVDLVVDWDDAPLPFKLYQGLPVIPLPSDVSPPVSSRDVQAIPSVGLHELGAFLWHSYGLTGLCHTVVAGEPGAREFNAMQTLRRYVPSGGALYPSELYAYLKIDGLPPGIYHYDVAHHRLVLLREGDFDDYLERALGHRCDMSTCFAALFVSTMFWRNFFKYNNFSYRLQGLDAGVLVGQLLEVAKGHGYDSFVFFQFLDLAINHLVGLDHDEETVYAVIPLSAQAGTPIRRSGGLTRSNRVESSENLCKELVCLHHTQYEKSKRRLPHPMITRMNEAAMMHSTEAFVDMGSATEESDRRDDMVVSLPGVDSPEYDFEAACRQRYSPGLDFVPDGLNASQASRLLWQTAHSASYDGDLDEANVATRPRITIATCVHGVDGIPDGAYMYDSKVHGLRLLRAGDQRMSLQKGMSIPNVNLFQVPLCLHLVGSRDFYQPTFGYRGHRIQQMEVGMLLQRMLLSASAMGMGGHPLLAYDEELSDDIYHFRRQDQQGQTCLIQVPVGFYRKVSRFEGALHG